MSNTAKYPLLICGFYSDQNGGNSTLGGIGASARKSWNNSIQQSRGDMVMLDVVPTFDAVTTEVEAVFSVLIAGVSVIQNATLGGYTVGSFARSYELLKIRQKAGQTLGITAVGTATNTAGLSINVYHENNCATPEIIKARNKSILKQRTIEIGGSLIGGVKFGSFGGSFTIPKSMGNVVGIQMLAFDDASGTAAAVCPITVSMGGTEIFKNVIASLFLNISTRPGLIFPIFIRGGETFEITGDTTAYPSGTTLTVKVKFYFDEDIEGTKTYSLDSCTQH